MELKSEISNKARKVRPVDVSKYKEGTFKHRKDNDECSHFGGHCHVRRIQKDPKYNVCESFCIPNRNKKETHFK